jgi:hypothetical protein
MRKILDFRWWDIIFFQRSTRQPVFPYLAKKPYDLDGHPGLYPKKDE